MSSFIESIVTTDSLGSCKVDFKSTGIVIRDGGIAYSTGNAAGTPVVGGFLASAGSASAPSFAFTLNPNTGIYNSATNTIGFAANGIKQASISASALAISPNGTDNWFFQASEFIAALDNTYDIGRSATFRPRSIYAGTSVQTPTVVATTGYQGPSYRVDATGFLFWNGRTNLSSSADGILRITPTADTTGVALDVSTDSLMKVRGQANAVNASVRVIGLQLEDGVTAPGTIAGIASIYIDTADGDLKIKYGDGVIKTIVIDT